MQFNTHKTFPEEHFENVKRKALQKILLHQNLILIWNSIKMNPKRIILFFFCSLKFILARHPGQEGELSLLVGRDFQYGTSSEYRWKQMLESGIIQKDTDHYVN